MLGASPIVTPRVSSQSGKCWEAGTLPYMFELCTLLKGAIFNVRFCFLADSSVHQKFHREDNRVVTLWMTKSPKHTFPLALQEVLMPLGSR